MAGKSNLESASESYMLIANSLSYRNSSAENEKSIWLQAHFGAALGKKFI